MKDTFSIYCFRWYENFLIDFEVRNARVSFENEKQREWFRILIYTGNEQICSKLYRNQVRWSSGKTEYCSEREQFHEIESIKKQNTSPRITFREIWLNNFPRSLNFSNPYTGKNTSTSITLFSIPQHVHVYTSLSFHIESRNDP